MQNRGNRRGRPTASDSVRVMTDGHAEGYHGRPAPVRARGAKGPGSHITQRAIHNRTYRPVDGRQVAHIEDGMIMYTPTEEEYKKRAQEWETFQQNMPNASDKEIEQAFQQYQQEKASRQNEPFDIYEFLQGMGIETNKNLSGQNQRLLQLARQPRQPEMMQEMPISSMQQQGPRPFQQATLRN